MQTEGNKIPSGSTDDKSKKPVNDKQEGSKTDPQLTELDGLKKGGVDPHVNPEDEALDNKGRKDN